MEIGGHIKERRAAADMSQDDLAARVYVSRQTISSWENGKTYPDLQSLLLLSEVFGVTVDTLIKGDVETMTTATDRTAQTLQRLGYAMIVFLVLTIAALVWVSVQLVAWDWPLAQAAPTITLAIVLWAIAMFAACWADHIKRDHDLITYHEILAFMRNEPVNRDSPRGRRERTMPAWMKAIRTIGLTLFALAVGAFLGYGGAALVDTLLG